MSNILKSPLSLSPEFLQIDDLKDNSRAKLLY